MVPGVVVFSSVVVWGIEWYVLCAGGCGIVDPHSVEETEQRGGQVPQHAGQSITSALRAGSPQGLVNSLSLSCTHRLTDPALCHLSLMVSQLDTNIQTHKTSDR